jgi:hypothetical protein
VKTAAIEALYSAQRNIHHTHVTVLTYVITTSGTPCRYDSHRDQILRSGERHQAGGGGGGFSPGERPDDEIDLFQYFSSSCYSGFGDGPKV